jgi:hypothetical protein
MNKIEIKCYLLKQYKSKIRDSDELDAKIKRFAVDSLRFADLKSKLSLVFSIDSQKTNLSIYYRDDEDELVEIENDNDMEHAFNNRTLVKKVYITFQQNEDVAANYAQVNLHLVNFI